MHAVHTANVWASVSGMPGPILAQINASGEAIAVFTAVVLGMASAITVLFKMLLSEQKDHRQHISTLVAAQEETVRTLNTNHEKLVQKLYADSREDRKEYMVDMRASWASLAEIEEKRQQGEQRLVGVLGELEKMLK